MMRSESITRLAMPENLGAAIPLISIVEVVMNRFDFRRIPVASIAVSSWLFSAIASAQTPTPTAATNADVNQPRADQPNVPAAAPMPVPQQVEARSAAPPAAVPSNQPMIQLAAQAPAPAPVVARTDKTHDGFYARLSLGFASQGTTIDDGANAPNLDSRSGALVIDALIGGAPAPGVVLGGALLFDRLPSTTFDADGFRAKTGVTLFTIGPFIDGYPNPRGGFHLGGTVGPCLSRLTNGSYFGSTRATGFGLAAWLGYDWWVADQWSVGGLLRFSGANTSHSDNSSSLSVDTRSVALMFTAVYQ
jgi:hypothetical protein